jgi:cytochrome b
MKTTKTIKVWDLAVRGSHLALAALVLGAFLTSDEDAQLPLHTRLGLALLGVVVFRVVWGFWGTPHARFADFVRSPREVLAAARAMARGNPGQHLGHNPVGGVMVLTLLATLATVAASGVLVALGPEFTGPLSAVLSRDGARAVKEVHEAAAWTLPVLVAFHVAGVLLSSALERQNLVKGMVTGFKRAPRALLEGPGQEPGLRPAARIAGFAAGALLALGTVLLLWRLMPVGVAEAVSREPLLGQYRAAALVDDPSFQGFDAARGKALYVEEHEAKNGKVSCATCHTPDPTREGKSPVGKVIEPLAPSANERRFSDPAKADKWFDRNCKQVLGRPCTARERGDFLTYVITF